ncbi:uncharacterized protein LOC100680424 [Nasonia vitripennis]|uniref:Uncharacterized protein n=1 Tax=Nasonia vitripennis TaxID=7425 RepID=A0A7M7QKW2_NASVI|nr:uncharacterized protein LOC100680424 [Nasonia vitripennis]
MLAQKESLKKVITEYKSKILMDSCQDFTLEGCNDDSGTTRSDDNQLNKIVNVRLTNCLVPSNSNTKEIEHTSTQKTGESYTMNSEPAVLSDISNIVPVPQKTQKARKSFISSKTVMLQGLDVSTNKDKQQLSINNRASNSITPETIAFRKRLARLRRISDSSLSSKSESPHRAVSPHRIASPHRTVSPHRSPTPHRSVSPEPRNLFRLTENEQNMEDDDYSAEAVFTIQNVTRVQEIPLNSTEKNCNAENVNNCASPDLPIRETSDDDDDDDDDDETDINQIPLKHLFQFKHKLYKTYKRKKFDLKTEKQETYKRYEEVDGQIYLGMDCKVGPQTWRIANTKKYITIYEV